MSPILQRRSLFGALRFEPGGAARLSYVEDGARKEIEVRGGRAVLATTVPYAGDEVLENVLVDGVVEGGALRVDTAFELPLKWRTTAAMTAGGPMVGDRELIGAGPSLDVKRFVRALTRGDRVPVEVSGAARLFVDPDTQQATRRVLVGYRFEVRGDVVRVALDDDSSLFNGMVELRTRRGADGRWVLEDPNGRLVTRTPAGPIVDDDDRWGDPREPEWLRAAVDAHFAGQMTLDFLRDVLGRDSVDGLGRRVEIVVHDAPVFGTANWDGNVVNLGGPTSTRRPIATLDVVAHEIGHALVRYLAGLDSSRFEPNALNEGFADIIGMSVLHYASTRKKTTRVFDWAVGRGLARDPADPGLRFPAAPAKDGKSVDHMSKLASVGDPHHAAGILTNAFYLAAAGGTNATSGLRVATGVGVETASRIFIDALGKLKPDSGFRDARDACVDAAARYGPQALRAVVEAWDAVGLAGGPR